MAYQIPAEIVHLLLDWYDVNARLLPWRDDPTPYRVWVSEIMLQQTRVEAVMPYFERFLRVLPTVQALAEADEELLLKLWEGLGYYNRVRNMQKAAKIIVEQYGGALPASPQQLQKLPGIGVYTSGAIASIAFQHKTPAVDGNVLRVLSRLTSSHRDISDNNVKKETGTALAAILPDRVGDFNQALMELGAMICLPNGAPKCPQCPLAQLCLAHLQGIEETLPIKSIKSKRRIEYRTVLLAICDGKIAINKRPSTGLLACLWEFPSLEGSLSDCEIRKYLTDRGWPALSVEKAGAAKHVFTHLEWHMTGYLIRLAEKNIAWTWVSPEELTEQYSIPSAFRAYTDLVTK